MLYYGGKYSINKYFSNILLIRVIGPNRVFTSFYMPITLIKPITACFSNKKYPFTIETRTVVHTKIVNNMFFI